MNDTQLTPRLKRILNLLAQYKALTRNEIGAKLARDYTTSKPTLNRDLSKLTKAGLINTTGQSRNTVYQLKSSHPLLTVFDLDNYFSLDADIRTGKKTLDVDIFPQLPGLFSHQELQSLLQAGKSFQNETKKLDPTIMIRELERFVIELAWKSSKIEGNTYSLLETEALLTKNQSANGHSQQEAIMILNHKRVFETILTKREMFKTINLSEISQLHQQLVQGLNITPGIRHSAVGITGTNYRPPDNHWQITDALNQAIKAINQSSFPLEKALLAVSLISYIQPFNDGNKRTGRMLGNALLLAHDCFPLSYRSVAEDEYKEALLLFYEQNSLYHLKRLLTEQYLFALKTYFI